MEQNPYQTPTDEPKSERDRKQVLLERSRLWKRRFWRSLKLFAVGLLASAIGYPTIFAIGDRQEAVLRAIGRIPSMALILLIAIAALGGMAAWTTGLFLAMASGAAWYVCGWQARRHRRTEKPGSAKAASPFTNEDELTNAK